MGTRLGALCCLLLMFGAASAEEGYGPLIANGLDEELAIGADLFFSETFGGNGRTCATCHFAADNYTLPAELSGLPANDLLLIADPEHPNFVDELELCEPTDGPGGPLDKCRAILENGLILVNADETRNGPDGFPSYSMRSVPHTLSLPLTLDPGGFEIGDATGWSGDGAPGDRLLRSFAEGAFRQHFTHDTARMAGHFPIPTSDEADALLEFQLALGRSTATDIDGVGFLDTHAKDGRTKFREGRRCGLCHALGGTMPNPFNFNFDTGIEEARIADCASSTEPGRCREASALLVPGANFDGGNGIEPIPGGRWGDKKFNIPPLIEAADTGPFFHDNGKETLEEAIAFYRSSFFSDAQCPPPPGFACGLDGTPPGVGEREIGAFLRIINSGLNLAMAAQRLHWTFGLLATESGSDPTVVETLLLAREELADARAVIDDVQFDGVDVFANTDNHLTNARAELDQLIASVDSQIANGTSGLQLVIALMNLIAISEDHLGPGFYDESASACNATIPVGQYDSCRWIFDLGAANVLFDNRGVTPGIVAGETEITWTPHPGGTATIDLKWRTAEWTNPLFEETLFTIELPGQDPVVLDVTGTPTQLANGQYERSYSYTTTCVPSAKYRVDATARVGGVTEIDSDMVKAPRYCLGS